MSDPWHAWSELAGKPWGHVFEFPGTSQAAQVQHLEEEREGTYRWVEESLHRSHVGLWFFLQRGRTLAEGERVRLLAASSPDELVVAVRAQLGMPPGRVELFGRAGMEIGMEPDNEIEGDELEGPIPGEEPCGEETSEITLDGPIEPPAGMR